MAIAEKQLETWSKQGPTGQFTDTYQSMRGNLLDKGAPYPVADVDVFLQGSYGNDTNVYADSDVDIVLKHTGAYYYDLSQLPADHKARYESEHSGSASYGYTQFKADAEGYIKRLYNGVQTGTKAVHVPGNNGRRNADILVCQQFRRYTSYEPGNVRYHEGVAFFSGGKRIDNFPKQHSANCTAKHQSANGNFKPMVRVFKNMRNAMIEKGFLANGIAPSYFIEGMLWNVPADQFTGVRRYVCRLLQLDRSSRRVEARMRKRSLLACTRQLSRMLAVRRFSDFYRGIEDLLAELNGRGERVIDAHERLYPVLGIPISFRRTRCASGLRRPEPGYRESAIRRVP